MTLPKGFGSGYRTCPKCRQTLMWSASAQEEICVNRECSIGRGEKPTQLPFTAKQMKLSIWYFMLWSLSLVTFASNIWQLGLIFFFVVQLLGTFVGLMMFDPSKKPDKYKRRSYTHREVFPWFIPFMDLSLKVTFKDES